MLTRGIVRDVSKAGNKLRVSIPIVNGIDTNKDKKINDDDYTMEASIMCIPGLSIEYREGDIVIVGFEDNDLGKPIVLGFLKLPNDVENEKAKEKGYPKKLSGNFATLSVSDRFKTGTNVSLGLTSYEQMFNIINDASKGASLISKEDKAKLDSLDIDGKGNILLPSLASLKVKSDAPNFDSPTYVCVFNNNSAPQGLAWCSVSNLKKMLNAASDTSENDLEIISNREEE